MNIQTRKKVHIRNSEILLYLELLKGNKVTEKNVCFVHIFFLHLLYKIVGFLLLPGLKLTKNRVFDSILRHKYQKGYDPYLSHCFCV